MKLSHWVGKVARIAHAKGTSRSRLGSKYLPTTTRLKLERLEDRVCPTSFYDLDIIAASGGTTQGGEQINFLSSTTSINNSGKVAFIGGLTGSTGSGTAVLVGDQPGIAPTNIAFPVQSTRDFAFSQIAEDNLVVARDRVSGAPAAFLIRTWDAVNPPSFTTLVRGGGNFGTQFSSVTLPTRAEDGGVAFVGIVGSQTGLYFHSGSTDTLLLNLTGVGGGFRPMAANGGRVVIRAGGSATNPIALYDPATGPIQIASGANGFASVGAAPGISDDGSIVVFYGELTRAGAEQLTISQGVQITPGPGIFASVQQGAGRVIVRVAGSVNPIDLMPGGYKTDPGERRLLQSDRDAGPDFNYDGNADWEIGSFSIDNRVGVQIDSGGEFAYVVFAATNTLTGRNAVFSTRLNLFADSIGVEAYSLVAEAGVGALSFASDLNLYDPVNNQGQVVLAATGPTSQAIVRATQTVFHPNSVDNVNFAQRFKPDSPLVEYVVAGIPGNAPRTAINQIILHATGGVENINIRDLTQSSVPSVHYLISLEGRVTQIVREADTANHAPPANPNSIGIELEDGTRYKQVFNADGTPKMKNGKPVFVPDGLTGHLFDSNWATPIQLKKAALLVRDIADRNGIVTTGVGVTHLTTASPAVGPWDTLVPLEPGITPDRSGIGRAPVGVLAHGQVLNRTAGRTDPQNFPDGATSPGTSYLWTKFMTQVNGALGVQLHAGANILITDPLGRRSGVDPATGNILDEIPGARFLWNQLLQIQQLIMNTLLQGLYHISIWFPLGPSGAPLTTPEGSVEIWASDSGGNVRHVIAPAIGDPGTIVNYDFMYAPASADTSTLSGDENLLPTAADDFAFTALDVPVVLDLTNNDTDPENMLVPASVLIVQNPVNGTVTIAPQTGMVTYTPHPEFFGTDSFQYTVQDADGGTSNTAMVSLTVLADTIAPDANDDTASTSQGVPVAIDVLANDSDTDGTIDPSTVEITEFGEPAHGDLAINETTGAITYTPEPGFTGVDSFIYVVRDDLGALSNEARVEVTVNDNGGSPPVAVDDEAITDEGTAIAIAVLDNDFDPDGDPLTVTSVSTPTNGLATDNGDGTITYTPTDDNFNGTDSFVYTITDGQGGTSSATVRVTVNPVNDRPTANALSFGTAEDNSYDGTVTGSDGDPEVAQSLIFAVANGPFHGTVALDPATGAFTYTPEDDYNGPDSFSFTVSDDDSAGGTALTSSEAVVTIEMSAVNDAPLLTVPGSKTTPEDIALTITGISVADVDVSEGTGEVQVILGVISGTLTVAGDIAGGLTLGQIAGNGTGAVVLRGPLAAVNTTLAAGVRYLGSLNFNGDDTLSIHADDLGNSGAPGAQTADAAVLIHVQSPAEQIAHLRALVEALYAQGSLNQGQSNALLTKLAHIELQVAQGNTRVAYNIVGAFKNHVLDLIATGVLSHEEGDALVFAADLLRESLLLGGGF